MQFYLGFAHNFSPDPMDRVPDLRNRKKKKNHGKNTNYYKSRFKSDRSEGVTVMGYFFPVHGGWGKGNSGK